MTHLFASFGGLKLAYYTAPGTWSHSVETALVEHKVVEGKAQLEWTGDELRKIDLTIQLAEFYCDPPAVARQLEEMRASRTAYPLTRGDGQPDGEWAIKSIKTDLTQTDREGVPTFLKLTISLIESPPKVQSSAVARPAVGRPAATVPRVASPSVRTETRTNADGVTLNYLVRGGAR